MKRYRKSRRRSSQRNNRSRYSRKKRGLSRKIKGGNSLYTAPIAAANFPISIAPSTPFTIEPITNHTQYA